MSGTSISEATGNQVVESNQLVIPLGDLRTEKPGKDTLTKKSSAQSVSINGSCILVVDSRTSREESLSSPSGFRDGEPSQNLRTQQETWIKEYNSKWGWYMVGLIGILLFAYSLPFIIIMWRISPRAPSYVVLEISENFKFIKSYQQALVTLPPVTRSEQQNSTLSTMDLNYFFQLAIDTKQSYDNFAGKIDSDYATIFNLLLVATCPPFLIAVVMICVLVYYRDHTLVKSRNTFTLILLLIAIPGSCIMALLMGSVSLFQLRLDTPEQTKTYIVIMRLAFSFFLQMWHAAVVSRMSIVYRAFTVNIVPENDGFHPFIRFIPIFLALYLLAVAPFLLDFYDIWDFRINGHSILLIGIVLNLLVYLI
eukprot:Awhi_evm1s2027